MTYAKALALTSLFAAAVGANASVVLMDQMGTTNQTYASQQFEAAYEAYDINAIDDFTTTGAMTVTKVTATMDGWNNFSEASWQHLGGFRVEIYTSVNAGAANLVGDAGSQTVALADATITTLQAGATASTVELPVSIALSQAGTYWIGVMGILDYGTDGQIGVCDNLGSATPGGLNAYQVNPGQALLAGSQLIGGGTNLQYKVEAEAVPEPATLSVLGLGALALIRRRRAR